MTPAASPARRIRGQRFRPGTVIVALVALTVTMITPQRASAVVASCNPNRPHDNAARYVITTATVNGVNGISSSILELNPMYSGSNGAGTNSTIMLVNSTLSEWAQLGWFKSQITSGSTLRESGLEFYQSSSQNY